jgi:hypothetical protein
MQQLYTYKQTILFIKLRAPWPSSFHVKKNFRLIKSKDKILFYSLKNGQLTMLLLSTSCCCQNTLYFRNHLVNDEILQILKIYYECIYVHPSVTNL